jgi:hypothetical protein
MTTKRAAGNRRLAQWRVNWLIEHLPFGRQVPTRINFCGVLIHPRRMLRNPPLRQAPNR